MEISAFTNKTEMPDIGSLKATLAETFDVWEEIRMYVLKQYPKAIEEWSFFSAKYGWGFRLKDPKRAIVYLGPRNQYFLVSFVYGNKATIAALASNISEGLKTIITESRVYAEGRGVRLEVRDSSLLADIKTLVDIKLAN